MGGRGGSGQPAAPKQPVSITIESDAKCHVTGAYFCTDNPFSLPRSGNKITPFSSGKHYYETLAVAIKAAQKFIFIADWQMGHDVELEGRFSGKTEAEADKFAHLGRLSVLLGNAMKRGVNVFVLLYDGVNNVPASTHDDYVQDELLSLNSSDRPGKIDVIVQNQTSGSGDFSHHQKMVIIDGLKGYIGGMDLTHGRWETQSFDLILDPDKFVINEMYNPCLTKARKLTPREMRLIGSDYGKSKGPGFAVPFTQGFGSNEDEDSFVLDEGFQPRMPWQDVHVCFEGPSVVDLARNFIRRWNLECRTGGANGSSSSRALDGNRLTSLNIKSGLVNGLNNKPGKTFVQVLRTVSANHNQLEYSALTENKFDDLQLEPKTKANWEQALKAFKSEHTRNIYTAMTNCIQHAESYIYIESQFFVSLWGKGSVGKGAKKQADGYNSKDPKPSRRIGGPTKIENQIAHILANRINDFIRAKKPFHVFLVMPNYPEGDLSEPCYEQHYAALQAIHRGSDSLVGRVQNALKKAGRPAEEWTQYLTFLNLRNYGVSIAFARNKYGAPDFNREIGRFAVTEQIYVHSKCLIADDRVAIVGSANINDRSLMGSGDTEIAIIMMDEERKYAVLGDNSKFTTTISPTVQEMRIGIWSKLLGLNIDQSGVDNPEQNDPINLALRSNFRPAKIDFPPRLKVTPGQLVKFANKTLGITIKEDEFLKKPAHPDTIKLIQGIARHNTALYEQVFRHTPRNKFAHVPAGKQLFTSGLDLYPEGTGGMPPALNQAFMQNSPSPKSRDELCYTADGKRAKTFTRNGVYAGGNVLKHDTVAVMKLLKNNLIGFWTEMPLFWGVDQAPSGAPWVATAANVSIAMNETAPKKEQSA